MCVSLLMHLMTSYLMAGQITAVTLMKCYSKNMHQMKCARKTPVISTDDRVTSTLNSTVALATFMLEGNAEF